jgi:hypothetical protein
MKKSITLAALFLFLGIGAFASTPTKSKAKAKTNMHNQVSLIPLRHSRGFAVMVDKALPGKSMVIVYDSDQNVLFKDRLTKGTRAEKKYMLGELDNGTYTVEVYSKGHDVKTKFYIYNKGERRIVDIM